MPHEIEQHDNVLVHTEQAWHGLGQVIGDDLSPTQALVAAEMDWEVTAQPVFRQTPDGQFVRIENTVCNTRMDVGDHGIGLGLVSTNYERVQNSTLAEFGEELSKTKQVVVETCGSIRNGQRVWFLCRADSFSIGSNDVVFPYLLLSNGHDGASSLRVTPTTVRVVCSNTLHMVIPDRVSDRRVTNFGVSLKHNGNIMQRVDQVREVLASFSQTTEQFKDAATSLQRQQVKPHQLNELFARWWQRDFRPIPSGDALSNRQQGRIRKVREASDKYIARFEHEALTTSSGTSLWTAVNAYTGLLQHDLGSVDSEARLSRNLFGTNAQRSVATWQDALNQLSA